MNQIGKKLAALLPALCLLLSLAACGDKEDNGAQTISGTVYVPTFAGITSNAEYIYQGCASEEYFYFLGNIQGEEHEETSTWTDENGEEHTDTYTYYDYRTGLFRAPLTGGAAEELPGFQMTELPEGTEGGVDIGNLRAGPDGTLVLMETVNINNFELPEGFNPDTDNKWDYYVDNTTTVTLRRLDGEGNEIDSVDLTGLEEKAGLEWTNAVLVDDAGNIYTNSDTKLVVLDSGMNVLFTLEGEEMWGDLILLSDGNVGMRNSYYDEEKQASGNRIRTIDLAAKDWGASYELSQSAYEVYPGGGEYLFYYRNGDSVYGRRKDAAEGERVFSWISSDINENNVQFFTFLPDGRVAALTQDWSGENRKYESAILTPTDASTLPQKTTLTYACMGLRYDVRNQIIEFNKTSDLYRIEVQDYGEYNTGEDTTAGLTKMNTEILAGHVPDMLDAGDSMPIAQYGAKGLLADLWPFIEADEEIGGRSGVMEQVLKAAEQDGKLYRIFDKFDIRTVEGASRIVGDRTSWTLADLKSALSQMPEGCSIFGVTDTKAGMLQSVLSCNMDNFVDWSTGECSFDSDNFKALLSFCNEFPEEFNWDNVNYDEWEEEDQRVMAGKQMLRAIYLDSFTTLQRDKGIFGGDVSFVGYPMEDGSCGSSFQIMGVSYAMSAASKNQEGVWSFIRTALLPQPAEEGKGAAEARPMAANSVMIPSSVRSFYDFPVNKKDFDAYLEFAMTEEFQLDENGQQILDEEGQPIKVSKQSYWVSTSDGTENWIEVYAATQEEVDQVMDLINSITTVWSYDTSIYDIVMENVGAYFAGDRTLDDTATRIQSAVKLYVGEQM